MGCDPQVVQTKGESDPPLSVVTCGIARMVREGFHLWTIEHMNDTTTTQSPIVGWAILEMHHSQLRTMVRGMAATEAAAWQEAFGSKRPKRSKARAEALNQEEWDYWQQYYC